MAAPKGNEFWKARAKHGRDKILGDPEVLWEECQGYFEWVRDNPLMEARPFAYQGEVTMANVPRMRAMTLEGLCLYLGMGRQTWRDRRNDKDLSEVVTRVEEIIRAQKFEGAAADLLNPNIIARDLGLADKQEHTSEVKVETDFVGQLGDLLGRLDESG